MKKGKEMKQEKSRLPNATAIKAAHPTLVIVKCADSERTLDAALVFIRAGDPIDEAAQAGADAGIPDAVVHAEIPLPDDFDAGEYGLYWSFPYIG